MTTNGCTHLARASMDSPWLLRSCASGRGSAGCDKPAGFMIACAAAGWWWWWLNCCMYCMCPRCVGGWLYPFASSGDFSMRGESENGKVGNIEPVERKTTKKKNQLLTKQISLYYRRTSLGLGRERFKTKINTRTVVCNINGRIPNGIRSCLQYTYVVCLCVCVRMCVTYQQNRELVTIPTITLLPVWLMGFCLNRQRIRTRVLEI